MTKKKTRRRRTFTTDQKVAILRRHLSDKVSVADLCEEYRLQPSVFYTWQRQMLENLGASLEKGAKRRSAKESRLKKENEALRTKLQNKDGVIAEVAAEMISLKKELGEL